MNWDVVIGLEVHLQLATKSKIFSGSATQFGAEPNTQANAVDLAMPGMLPVLNEQAVRYAVLFGLGIGAEVCRRSVFDRKNYFYPDSPKGYQISQFEQPIVGKGEFTITLPDGSEKTISITRAHLEEDAGKSLHEAIPSASGIDLNRAGTPLLEIVSEPDIRSATEAVAYLKALHTLVTYLGISDGDMSQGSMRCDINLSLRPKGSDKLGTRTEIKNVNSFRFVERAIRSEIERQADILEDGGTILQETRLYDSELDETRAMRSKEIDNDYRYFPDPDLLPIELSEVWIKDIEALLPELPKAKRLRFKTEYHLSDYDANALCESQTIANYFEQVSSICQDPKLTANWILSELMGQLNAAGLELDQNPVTAQQLGELIARIKDNTLSSKMAKQVFDALWQGQGEVAEIIEAQGLKQVSDDSAIEALVDAVITNNPDQVAQYRAADDVKRKKLIGFFVGQIMKASKGQANPQLVNSALEQALNSA